VAPVGGRAECLTAALVVTDDHPVAQLAVQRYLLGEARSARLRCGADQAERNQNVPEPGYHCGSPGCAAMAARIAAGISQLPPSSSTWPSPVSSRAAPSANTDSTSSPGHCRAVISVRPSRSTHCWG